VWDTVKGVEDTGFPEGRRDEFGIRAASSNRESATGWQPSYPVRYRAVQHVTHKLNEHLGLKRLVNRLQLLFFEQRGDHLVGMYPVQKNAFKSGWSFLSSRYVCPPSIPA